MTRYAVRLRPATATTKGTRVSVKKSVNVVWMVLAAVVTGVRSMVEPEDCAYAEPAKARGAAKAKYFSLFIVFGSVL